jgi:hypothetical protein
MEIPDAVGAVEWWKEGAVPLSDMETVVITGELEKKKETNYILNCLRNALAHGNVFTPGGGEITEIVFFQD